MRKTFKKSIAVLLAVLMVVFSAPLTSFAMAGSNWWTDADLPLSAEPSYTGYMDMSLDDRNGNAFQWGSDENGEDGPNGEYITPNIDNINTDDGNEHIMANYRPAMFITVSSYASRTAVFYGKNAAATYSAATIKDPSDLKAGDTIAFSVEFGGFDSWNLGQFYANFDTSYLQIGTWGKSSFSASNNVITKTDETFYSSGLTCMSTYTVNNSDGSIRLAMLSKWASSSMSTYVGDRPFGEFGVMMPVIGFKVLQDCDLRDVLTILPADTYVSPVDTGTDLGNEVRFALGDREGYTYALMPVQWNGIQSSTPVSNTYTVTVQNPDGTTNTTISDVAEGTLLSEVAGIPALSTFTTTSGYTTTTYKWDTPLTTAVNSDITIKAIVDQQTTEQFTVTFKTADDRADIVETVPGGTLFGDVTAPAHSAQTQDNTTIYTWNGWDKAADFAIGENIVVNETATTATRYYTVTFVTADDRADVVNSTVEYNTDLASLAPAQSEPVVTAATTTTYKWDIADGAKVTANTTVNEVTDQVTTNTYTVTFVTADSRDDIVVNDVEYGTQISTILPAQSEPVVTAYSTTTYKWDVANDATVEGNTTINEVVDQVTGATYTVSFYDVDGNLVKDVEVAAGNTVAAADIPANTAAAVTAATTTTYKWDTIPAEITADTRIDEVVDQVTTNVYTITFNNYDGTLNSTQDVAYGSTPTAPETRTATAQYTYAWPTLETVTGDATYTETRTVNTYTVVFKNAAGDTVKEMADVEYGTEVTAPANTATAPADDTNHNVYSWPAFSATVVADATIEEVTTPEAHTWTDGDVITPATFDAPGEQAIHCDVCGADSTKVLDQLTGGISVTVEAATLGTTTLNDVDATAGLTQKFAENARITLTATPSGDNTFVGWAVGKKIVSDATEFSTTVNATITYTPVFAEVSTAEYSIVFVDSYGNILKNQTVTAPDQIEAPTVSDRVGYTFTGWEPADYATKTESTTVVAQFAKNPATTFTVTVPAGATIKVNGTAVDGTTADVAYDTMVTVSAESATAWYANGSTEPVGYGEDYTFYVGADLDLTFETTDVAVTPTVLGVSVTAPIDASAWKVTFLASRTIPAGFTLEKAGFVYGKDIADDDLVLANVNGTTIRAMYMQNMNADQFELSTGVKAKTAGAKISARAFIIYSDGTGLHTVESNVLSYTY